MFSKVYWFSEKESGGNSGGQAGSAASKKVGQDADAQDSSEHGVDDGNSSDEGDESESDTGADRKPGQTVPLNRLNKVIAERNKLKELLEKQQRDADARETERLKKQNDFEGLFTRSQGEVDRLKPFESRVEELETTLQEVLEAQLAQLDRNAQSLVPADLPIEKQLKWIAANRAYLSKPTPFDVAAGQRGAGGGKTKVKVTPEQARIAESYGMTVEEYLKFADAAPADTDQT